MCTMKQPWDVPVGYLWVICGCGDAFQESLRVGGCRGAEEEAENTHLHSLLSSITVGRFSNDWESTRLQLLGSEGPLNMCSDSISSCSLVCGVKLWEWAGQCHFHGCTLSLMPCPAFPSLHGQRFVGDPGALRSALGETEKPIPAAACGHECPAGPRKCSRGTGRQSWKAGRLLCGTHSKNTGE